MRITTEIKDKRTYSIIGLPKSGTTIFSKAINSVEDSICLSEPIRTMHNINLSGAAKSQHDYDCIRNATDNFLHGYQRFVRKNSDFKIGGVKETYSSIPSRVNEEVKKVLYKSDFLIFIIREPKVTFSAWKELKWNSDGLFRPSFRFNVEMFCQMYKDLIEKYHTLKMKKPTFLVRYEDFCNNFSSDWMNSIFRDYLQFEGEMDKMRELNGSGDLKCKQTNEILTPRTTYTNLTKEEVEIIDERLSDVYKNLRGYGYY